MQELITFISQHAVLSIAAVIILILLLFVESLRARRKSLSVTPAQATQLINHDHATIIDIRPQEIYNKGHIIEAQSLTPQDLLNQSKKLEKFKNRPLIIACHTGLESQKIAAQLIKQGYNAYALAGGMRAWVSADMPLVRGRDG